MRTRVTDYLLYRWRYILGGLLIIATVASLLFVVGIYVPGGLRPAEQASAIQSGNLSIKNLDSSMVVQLPYHLLQRLSFIKFGMSDLSIKLPSLVLSALTVLGLFLLLKTWFHRNTAVIGTLLAFATAQYLFLSQDGTPGIMFAFVSIWLLFVSTAVSRKHIFGLLWKVLTGLFLALSLYIPLGIYLDIAIVVTAFSHPHIRYLIRKMSRIRLAVAAVLAAVSLSPLVYSAFVDPGIATSLLGIPTKSPDILANLNTVGETLFWPTAQPVNSLISPLYTPTILMIILVGLYKLLTYKYTARSYITLGWALMLIPMVILNPGYVTDLFPLMAIMIAMGINTLIAYWYRLFPRNPYARIAGLIPLSVLVLGLVTTGVLSYMHEYNYNPVVVNTYSSDLQILNTELVQYPHGDTLLVAPDEKNFYDLVAHYDSRFHITTDIPKSYSTLIESHAGRGRQVIDDTPVEIVTNARSNAADRFYIYKSTTK